MEGAVSYRLLATRVFGSWAARWLRMRWASDFDRHVRGVKHTALAPDRQWRSDADPLQLFYTLPTPGPQSG